MSFRIGDAVYGVNGIPGVVKHQDKVSGDLKVDIDEKEVAKTHKYGYINGLTPSERESYTSHLDEVHEKEDPKEKVEAMRTKISTLRQEPSKVRLVKYLESELFHIMNTHNISPRFYSIETPKAPVNKS
jgi:hypothetical protein